MQLQNEGKSNPKQCAAEKKCAAPKNVVVKKDVKSKWRPRNGCDGM